MASVVPLHDTRGLGSTQFIVTLGRAEKARWKAAADAAGLSMAEYVRRAVGQANDAPSAAEIAEARALTLEVDASVARIESMLDRTAARIDALVDPAVEEARRAEILADLDARGVQLDLAALAGR